MRCKSYVENRIRNLKGLMIKNHIDAVIIEKPENVKYFSNFNPVINSSHVYILMRPDEDPIYWSIRCVRITQEKKAQLIRFHFMANGEIMSLWQWIQ